MGDKAEVLSFPKPSKMGKLPTRPTNKEVRTREYLTEQKVELLVNAARKTGRHDHRDATLILIAYRLSSWSESFRIGESETGAD